MVIILMGVTGSGKTTVGQSLADTLGWSFYDADDFHPPENKQKMNNGIPLDDIDREPWLEAIAKHIHEELGEGRSMVLACSALKRSYRKILRNNHKDQVRFVYLKGSMDLIASRLNGREHEFMNPTLLPSQFQTLEEPKGAVYIDITPSPPLIVSEIKRQLGIG
jgi:gluconokinase